MAIFAVSFRVGEQGDSHDRRLSIVEKIQDQALNNDTWEETTSLFILQSNKSADALASTICSFSFMNPSCDALIVIDLSSPGYATRGKIEYPFTLSALMSKR
jgi:hypothetical protein